jgi:hypothetical protein
MEEDEDEYEGGNGESIFFAQPAISVLELFRYILVT